MRKQVSESTIEKAVCKHAKLSDWLVYKFSSPAQRGVPDRVFLKAGRVVFVEFKATGKKATKQQIATHEKIREQGFDVFVIDNLEVGKALFND
jgi:hypothetical protein